jgi:hypothetical protein
MSDTNNAQTHIALKKRYNVFLPEKLVEDGQARAVQERRSFSNYVATLIEADLKRAAAAGEPSTSGVGA